MPVPSRGDPSAAPHTPGRGSAHRPPLCSASAWGGQAEHPSVAHPAARTAVPSQPAPQDGIPSSPAGSGNGFRDPASAPEALTFRLLGLSRRRESCPLTPRPDSGCAALLASLRGAGLQAQAEGSVARGRMARAGRQPVPVSAPRVLSPGAGVPVVAQPAVAFSKPRVVGAAAFGHGRGLAARSQPPLSGRFQTLAVLAPSCGPTQGVGREDAGAGVVCELLEGTAAPAPCPCGAGEVTRGGSRLRPGARRPRGRAGALGLVGALRTGVGFLCLWCWGGGFRG